MDSSFELPTTGPRRGQQYLDAQGRRWSVRQVCPLGAGGAGDYSVLDVSVRGADDRGASFRITCREFFTLASSGGLKMLRA